MPCDEIELYGGGGVLADYPQILDADVRQALIEVLQKLPEAGKSAHRSAARYVHKLAILAPKRQQSLEVLLLERLVTFSKEGFCLHGSQVSARSLARLRRLRPQPGRGP